MGVKTLFTPKCSQNFAINSNNIVTQAFASQYVQCNKHNAYKEIASIQMTSPNGAYLSHVLCHWFVGMSPLTIGIRTYALVFPRKRLKPPMLLFQ